MVFNQGWDEEREYQLRSAWQRFVAEVDRKIACGELIVRNRGDLEAIVQAVIKAVGRDAIVALSSEYAHGDRLSQLIQSTTDRLHELLSDGEDVATALASFAGDRAVRIMSIHKSKGLEFDTVIVLGVEKETFWGQLDAERSAYFVGISRAKRRLVLTTCRCREKPVGANNQWKTVRNRQAEFLRYAEVYA